MIGIESEKTVITYTNTLITAMNPRKEPQANVVPNPHPCSLDYKTILIEARDSQYEALNNCCQRHVCKIETRYCKSNPCDKCRFNFPMELSEATHIEFKVTGTAVKASIILKRNYPYMNNHMKIISANWWANVDMQIILDQAAAIAYMVKYATKAEKAGSSLKDLYKSVILYSTEDDNAITKLRSLILKTGKRDLGQCEVFGFLMS